MPATQPTLTLYQWLPTDATWSGAVVILIVGLLFAALVIGPVVRMLEAPAAKPVGRTAEQKKDGG